MIRKKKEKKEKEKGKDTAVRKGIRGKKRENHCQAKGILLMSRKWAVCAHKCFCSNEAILQMTNPQKTPNRWHRSVGHRAVFLVEFP